MGDLYDIQFQPILQENLEDNRVRIMNNREWTEEQKDRIVEIDHKEWRKGKNFMKLIKNRWHFEFLESKGQRKT